MAKPSYAIHADVLEELVELVAAEPGTHVRELIRRTGHTARPLRTRLAEHAKAKSDLRLVARLRFCTRAEAFAVEHSLRHVLEREGRHVVLRIKDA